MAEITDLLKIKEDILKNIDGKSPHPFCLKTTIQVVLLTAKALSGHLSYFTQHKILQRGIRRIFSSKKCTPQAKAFVPFA